ncbi:LysR family transcriptional regulator [Rhizosaccharibacter radicis]|uniref:LysR family transcriptional regulator n=1 Tax=Rhizosaccharibacter radicis TaxID=2782605 RepID=A0ABT1VYD4_9PROT|nr:LysR family transcriptional regulator [Acetobacteraceae bacterium KSS12]
MTSIPARLRLRQLQLVLAIDETRNLHRAAERLALSQPNATRLLQEIEHALEVRLFERGPQGMAPTPFGTLTVRHARLLLSDLNRLQQDLEGLKGGVSGTVRIGSITAALPGIVAPAVAGVIRDHPQIGVSIVTDTSDLLLVALQTGRLDFMVGRPLGAAGQAGLNVDTLSDEVLRIVCGTAHPLAARQALTLGDLAGERWVLQAEPSPMRRAVEAAFLRAGFAVPPHPVEASSVLATLSLLRHAPLLAVLPRSVSGSYAAAGMLAELPVSMPDMLGPFGLVSVAGRVITPAAERVRERLLAAARLDHDS